MWKTVLFGPLSSKACVYFYILTILSFVAICLAVFGGIGVLLNKPKLFDFKNSLAAAAGLANLLLVYFINRLFYTMCVKSLD
jgi:hypothetical protein